MSAKNSIRVETAEREFVMERVFNAPREIVFKAFSDPKHVAQWWGPKGWTLPVCEMDFRPGGVWFYGMRGPGGEESFGKAIYQEIIAPERIVYQDNFADAEGNVLEGMPPMVITMEFTEESGKTRITSRTLFASVADLEATMAMGMVEGFTQTWDRLEEYLAEGQSLSQKSVFTVEPAGRAITSTRVFDAPRELVYKAHTDPNLIPQWWGQRSATTIVDKMDVREGGVWRFVQREADGNEYAFNGVYREVVPPERLAYTFEYEGMPGHELVETITFEAYEGKTKLTSRSVFQSLEDLEGMLQSGMEAGANESMDRLVELLQAMQQG